LPKSTADSGIVLLFTALVAYWHEVVVLQLLHVGAKAA